MQEMSHGIYQELYVFDDKKLQLMAENLVLRMKEPEAIKLTTLINDKYKIV
jgi:hypothetical protein